MTLGSIDFRNNGIGFLRLFFASAVVWSHAYLLCGFGDDPITRLTHGALSGGALAVGGFFVLSGFLITRSFEHVDGLGRYLWHRCLRIFPGYWVCLIVVAFGFAPLLYLGQHATLAGFFAQKDSPWGFVVWNWLLSLNQLNVSGPYPSLPIFYSINSSLWTLKYEFFCYLAVGAFGIVGVLKRKAELVFTALIVLLIVSASLSAFRGMADTPYGARVLNLYVFFAMGACAYLFRDRIPMRWTIAVAAALALAIAMPTRAYGLFVPLCLSYLTLFAAVKLPIKSFDRRADLSYGVYIYAWPVQQLLAMYRLDKFGVFAYFAAAMVVVIPIAAVSWFLIEKPSLSLKDYAFLPRRAHGRIAEEDI
jgi:peptidoglycan/LPS O-acetylase OafA/YrhL